MNCKLTYVFIDNEGNYIKELHTEQEAKMLAQVYPAAWIRIYSMGRLIDEGLASDIFNVYYDER